MSEQHLDHSEDGELRRLAALYDFGTPAADVAERISELRDRDRRRSVRALRSADATVSVRGFGQ